MSERADTPPGVAANIAHLGKGYRIYALVILTIVYVLNYVDRQILAILLPGIKAELNLNDTQLGFLFMTFGIFYATLGIPIAMLADRTNRRNVVAAALTIFSLMTAACAFVANYIQLVILRVLVGVGEAGSSPPSHSMIADMFPPKARATALAFFSLGVNIGLLIGLFAGGWLAENYGWRTTFIIVGLPGVLMALVVLFTVKEPERGASDGVAPGTEETPAIGEVVSFLWSQKAFRHIALGSALIAFVGYAGVAWVPTFLARSFDMKLGEIGMMLGLVIGFAGGAGTFGAGFFADKLGHKDVRWNMWLVALAGVVAFPFGVALYLTDSKTAAILLFIAPAAAGAIFTGPAIAMTQGLAKLRMRATASAILFFILNLIGLGAGPQVVGMLSDFFAASAGEESVRYALLAITPLGLWGALHFFLAAKTLEEDLARAKA